jgi:peptidoglycan hydrolase CwlO-like protein
VSLRGARRKRILSAAALATLVAATSLVVVVAPRPAAADQITDLQAQARTVSEKLVREQLQVDAYQQQYSVQTAKVDADARTMARIGQQIDQDEKQINDDTRQVRQLAITSYMNGGPAMSRSDAVLFSGDVMAAQVAQEYTGIAAGNLESAVDKLVVAQRTLQVQQSALQQQQSADRADQQIQATYLAQATGTAQQLQTVQAEVTGQLATAVAQQAAAQAAAAAAAVAAAQKASAQKGASQKGAGSVPAGAGVPASSTVDPTLNPFLQCVVQAESGGDYGAVSPNGQYMGAFQFSQATWNRAAQAAGRPDLVGVPPNRASKADQDSVAVALYALDGEQPWLGDRCSG